MSIYSANNIELPIGKLLYIYSFVYRLLLIIKFNLKYCFYQYAIQTIDIIPRIYLLR